MAKTIVETGSLPTSGHSRPLKTWTKQLTDVNLNKSNGYAFEGGWVDRGLAELEIGSYVLHYWDAGSRSNNRPNVALYRVTPDGLDEIERWENLPRQWALACRDEIAALIAEDDEDNSADAEIAAAIALLEQHGYTVEAPQQQSA